jgi:hypothetical protein
MMGKKEQTRTVGHCRLGRHMFTGYLTNFVIHFPVEETYILYKARRGYVEGRSGTPEMSIN